MCFHSIKISGKINATILQELRGRGKMKNRAVGIVVLGMMMLLTCMMPAQVLGYSETDTKYPVTGGYLYFDKSSGAITGCDDNVTEAEIPMFIEGAIVSDIAPYAFEDQVSLTKISIPDSVTRIQTGAFSGCSELEEISLSVNLKTISVSVFSGCSKLESLQIPESVTQIEEMAFMNCESLSSIVLPDNLISVKRQVFQGCTSLKSIELPSELTTIEEKAFSGCSALENISIPSSVTEIGGEAFWECASLLSMTIPDGVTSIKAQTFYQCTSLKEITLPKSLNSIMLDAFSYCSSLTSVQIPENVTQLGQGAFLGCEQLSSIVIPEGITTLPRDFFSGCSKLTSVKLPDSLKTIEYGAFYKCTSLDQVAIPQGVTTVEARAFNECTSLTMIIIPSGVKRVEDETFSGCTSLEQVQLPEQLERIGEGAFLSCSALQGIQLPASVTLIGKSAFSGCRSITAIEIPDGTSLSYSVFSGCGKLKHVALPEGLSVLGEYLFRNCASLERLTIPKSVTSIETSAFYRSGLKEILIPGTVKQIKSRAFAYCYHLGNVQIESGVEEIGDEVFLGSSSMKSLYIPESVISIGEGAFWEKTALYGSAGCAAQDYASEHGLLFIECSERPEFPSDNEPPENPGGESPETGKQPQTIDVAKSFSKTYGCEPFELDASAKTALTYESSAPSVAAVSEDGTVSVKAGGIATITITAAENEKYKSASARVEIQVNKASQTIGGIVAADITRTYGCRPFHLGTSAKTAVTYKSSAPGVAAVSADGIVTVKSGGIVTLTVTAVETAQYKAAAKKVVLKINRASQTISGLRSYTKSFRVNGRFSLNAKAKTRLTYKSSNGKIAAVNSAGKVTMKNPGKVTITITAAGTNQYNGTSRKITINTKLKKPVLKVKAYKGRKIRITWSKVSGSSRYQLYVYDSKKKKYVRRLTKKASVKSVMHKGLKAGKVYKYKVRVYRMVSGKKVYSAYSSVKKARALR